MQNPRDFQQGAYTKTPNKSGNPETASKLWPLAPECKITQPDPHPPTARVYSIYRLPFEETDLELEKEMN